MEYVYIISVGNLYYSINVVFDETDGKLHVYRHDKNTIKWQPFDTIEEVERRLDELVEGKVIDSYFPL